ncbi:hypothetical protein R1flu_003376 [Riccia fluitans]|uniref:Uncharacterized protein n=1 Tax=Riccia fluitans TaxID=41844 RepID=A0ABD1Y8W1_9MARC
MSKGVTCPPRAGSTWSGMEVPASESDTHRKSNQGILAADLVWSGAIVSHGIQTTLLSVGGATEVTRATLKADRQEFHTISPVMHVGNVELIYFPFGVPQ